MESRLLCTPVPSAVTVGPGRPGPDPTWVVSADCEMGGRWLALRSPPPSLVSQVLKSPGS